MNMSVYKHIMYVKCGLPHLASVPIMHCRDAQNKSNHKDVNCPFTIALSCTL